MSVHDAARVSSGSNQPRVPELDDKASSEPDNLRASKGNANPSARDILDSDEVVREILYSDVMSLSFLT